MFQKMLDVQIDFGHLVTIDKARSAKHVSNNSLIKFCTKTIRNEKVPQKIFIVYYLQSKPKKYFAFCFKIDRFIVLP